LSILTDVDLLNANANLCWTEISLASICHNYAEFRRHVSPDVEIFPVIKADAYGHGALPIAKMLQDKGVKRFCVARVEEGVELRCHGITAAILIFAPPLGAQAYIAAQYNLEMLVCDSLHLEAIEQAREITGSMPSVHIKVDVGMGRLGIPPNDVPGFYRLCNERNISVIGIMGHYPCADTCDAVQTLSMSQQIKQLQNQLILEGHTHLIFHTANSAATMLYPDTWFDAVRVGISLYGQLPDIAMRSLLPLQPAMSLFARILYIKDVPANTPVSYGQTYYTKSDSRLATLAIGYGDGYPRSASGLTKFLIHGKPAPQVGRVCMDQLVVDITAIPEARIGDIAMAFGSSEEGTLRAEYVADLIGTIGYELTTRIGQRVPRIYKR